MQPREVIVWKRRKVELTVDVATCPYCDYEYIAVTQPNPLTTARLDVERHIANTHCPENNYGPHALEDTPYTDAELTTIRQCKFCGGKTGSGWWPLVCGQEY